ncbi:MAG: UbiA prenyltransferase family protein [Solirubrobacteraceae bacterium]
MRLPLQTVAGSAAPPQGARRRARRTPALVLESMRPAQWSKNAFVLAGVVFAGDVLVLSSLVKAGMAFVAFCLASGAAYLANDVRDAEGDRDSPRTAGRPIARGALSPRTALIAAAMAALASCALALAVNLGTFGVLAGFLALQLAYSTWLKDLLLIDVMAVSAGFVLRAVAGGLAVEVPVSPWLLLCTGVLALFLALAKRRGELVRLNGGPANRLVLDHYTLPLLDELIAVVTPTTVVVYAIYTVLGAATDTMLVTVPFVLYGIFRMLYLIHYRPEATEDPSEVVWRDRALLACVGCWGVSAAVISVVAA